ncbi:PfkB family carbohydrate kinase [Haloarcula litorea]|uniref:PfkB family carbohydrate kinase n=1 Tax=Haloarcula litorea TaxID=3032579 RepID=UPI0023E78F82|nr:PfkB family carbohydrate kinase [Halomicroarcula sp. GDY20]
MTVVTFGETALRFAPPDGRRFETAREVELRVDGMASNAAATASRLGGDAVWCSKVPDTPLGRRVVAELGEFGLETEVVWADEGRQGLTFHESAADPRADRLLQDRADTAMGTVTPADLPLDRVQDADAVFAAGSTAALSETAADTTRTVLQSAPGIRALDLDFHPDLWDVETARATFGDLFDAVDLLFASEEQAKTVFDRTGSARELVHTIASEFGFSRVVLTRSERGVVGYHDNVIHEQDAFDTDGTDAAGQHAALVGAVLERLADGAATDEALAYGAAAAALARTMPGPLTPIEAAEVDRLVADQDDRGR